MKIFSVCLLTISVLAFLPRAEAQSVYDFKVKTIDGADKSLGDYKGKVLLIVNTASKCGHTPQYAGLEKLHERYKLEGFEVLGFPENDFKNQEPGDNSQIKKFCELTYNVKFPLFSKIDVIGPAMAPLYQYLTTASGFNGPITWNFNKFLVDRRGHVIARFDSKVEPTDPVVEKDILQALAQQ